MLSPAGVLEPAVFNDGGTILGAPIIGPGDGANTSTMNNCTPFEDDLTVYLIDYGISKKLD